LLAVIILLGTPRRTLGAWLLPSLAASAVPVLIVVAQRRITGS
jgi:hypothetical protein